MMLLTDNECMSDIRVSVGSNSGSVSFKLFDKFYYRRIFNLHGKGPSYVRFNARRLDVSELILKNKL